MSKLVVVCVGVAAFGMQGVDGAGVAATAGGAVTPIPQEYGVSSVAEDFKPVLEDGNAIVSRWRGEAQTFFADYSDDLKELKDTTKLGTVDVTYDTGYVEYPGYVDDKVGNDLYQELMREVPQGCNSNQRKKPGDDKAYWSPRVAPQN
jgi:hypothetical protein